MVNIIPVSRARHGGKGWRRPKGYDFVAKLPVAPLGGSELWQAVGAMPIGFIERFSGTYMPVAIMALSQGRRLRGARATMVRRLRACGLAQLSVLVDRRQWQRAKNAGHRRRQRASRRCSRGKG
jgi:SapC protein